MIAPANKNPLYSSCSNVKTEFRPPENEGTNNHPAGICLSHCLYSKICEKLRVSLSLCLCVYAVRKVRTACLIVFPKHAHLGLAWFIRRTLHTRSAILFKRKCIPNGKLSVAKFIRRAYKRIVGDTLPRVVERY